MSGLTVFVVVVLVGTYTFLPPVLGSLLARSVQGQMELQSAPEVNLESEPPPSMLAGRVEEGRISLQDTDLGGIKPRRVTIDLDAFDLNVAESMRSGELASEQPLSGMLRMEVTEKEVTRVAAETAEDISIENVDLEKNRVTVETSAQVFGFEVPVDVQGGLEVRGQNLVFVPRRVAAFGVNLLERASDELLSQTDFSYPLGDLPYDAEVNEVQVEKDHLVVSGRLENIPLGSQNG